MKDEEFNELKIRVLIAPASSSWPSDTTAWQALHKVVTDARSTLADTIEAIHLIEMDGDLSHDGRRRRQKEAAIAAIVALEEARTLHKAREAVEQLLQRFAEKTGVAVKPATNAEEVSIRTEIRAELRVKDQKDRIKFVMAHADDPTIANAVLVAPAHLSGLSPVEFGMFKAKVEASSAPEIVKAREDLTKALDEAERGWETAKRKIAQRVGLVRNADGAWVDHAPKVAA